MCDAPAEGDAPKAGAPATLAGRNKRDELATFIFEELKRQDCGAHISGSPLGEKPTRTVIDGEFNLNVLAHRILQRF
jgi:hypothetical protein